MYIRINFLYHHQLYVHPNGLELVVAAIGVYGCIPVAIKWQQDFYFLENFLRINFKKYISRQFYMNSLRK